jgi:nitrogenase molybdenum-iron protein alpha chain
MTQTLTYDGVPIREHRLHSILSYHGTANDLNEKSKEQALSGLDRYYGQCGNCTEGCAESQAMTIRDAVVISHAPLGCAAGTSGSNVIYRAACQARGHEVKNIQHISTNMLEKDTVYGGADKLRFAIREADKRYSPKAIFVMSSCVAGIIGEDLDSITDEMEEELAYPVVPVACEGFKSVLWSSGFDMIYHAILRKVVEPPKQKQENLVNVFSFSGSDSFSPLLNGIGLEANYLVELATIDSVSRMSEAVCSVQMCSTLSMYLAHQLENLYGVTEIKVPSPYGISWTDQWLRSIAEITGKEALAETFIASEHERIAPEIAELSVTLQGKTVYVWGGDAWAMNIANIVKDFGMKLVGFNANHHDLNSDGRKERELLDYFVESNGEVPNFSVCNKQPFIVSKLLAQLKPDVVIIRHGGMPIVSAKLGIPTLFEGDVNYGIGYEGVLHLGRRLCAILKKKRFFDHIAQHLKVPYSDWWLHEADPFYFEGGQGK